MMKNFLFFSITIILNLTTYSQSKKQIFIKQLKYDVFDGVSYDKQLKPKNEISKKHNINISLITKDSISIKEKINIKSSSSIGNTTIYKFHDYESLIFNNSKKIELSLINDELIKVLLKINLKAFMAFYTSSKTPYLEINKLKPLVKDANGVLNIEKLAKVIEKNKSSLAKYLD